MTRNSQQARLSSQLTLGLRTNMEIRSNRADDEGGQAEGSPKRGDRPPLERSAEARYKTVWLQGTRPGMRPRDRGFHEEEASRQTWLRRRLRMSMSPERPCSCVSISMCRWTTSAASRTIVGFAKRCRRSRAYWIEADA